MTTDQSTEIDRVYQDDGLLLYLSSKLELENVNIVMWLIRKKSTNSVRIDVRKLFLRKDAYRWGVIRTL